MSNFRNAAVQALRSDRNLRAYEAQAEPVLSAVANAEAAVVRNLTQAAVSQGLSEQQARNLLRSAGLHAPEPTPVRAATPASAAPNVQAAAGDIAALFAFARQHGFNG